MRVLLEAPFYDAANRRHLPGVREITLAPDGKLPSTARQVEDDTPVTVDDEVQDTPLPITAFERATAGESYAMQQRIAQLEEEVANLRATKAAEGAATDVTE